MRMQLVVDCWRRKTCNSQSILMVWNWLFSISSLQSVKFYVISQCSQSANTRGIARAIRTETIGKKSEFVSDLILCDCVARSISTFNRYSIYHNEKIEFKMLEFDVKNVGLYIIISADNRGSSNGMKLRNVNDKRNTTAMDHTIDTHTISSEMRLLHFSS